MVPNCFRSVFGAVRPEGLGEGKTGGIRMAQVGQPGYNDSDLSDDPSLWTAARGARWKLRRSIRRVATSANRFSRLAKSPDGH
jgi:hypothetical protein